VSFTDAEHGRGAACGRDTATTAGLTINSKQADADIQVDGMFAGNAPATIQLVPGIHE